MEISTGIISEPHFVLIYGPDGIGKTTFAAQAPDSLIVGPESGSNRINVSRAKNIKSYSDIVDAIKWLRNEKHGFKSVGLDSLDWIEPLLWNELCSKHKWENIEDAGYGKGYTAALSYWNLFIDSLKDLRVNREMNIIAIAHSQVKTVNDPMQTLPYDRHMLKLNDKASARWREAADCVLFAQFEDQVFRVNKGDRKAKASDSDGGNRKLFTVRRAAYDAKNRLGLPSVLPLSWQAFSDAADIGQPNSAKQVSEDINEILKYFADKDKSIHDRILTAMDKAGADVGKLISIRNHARVLAEQGN